MAIGANSYGTVAGVGSLTPRFSGAARDFAATTRPLLAEVESWIDQVSGLTNSMLSQEGFAVPITQADAKLGLDFFVNEEVASMVEGVNGSGRFGPVPKQSSGTPKGRFAILLDDVEMFIKANSNGLENLGVTRSKTRLKVAYRDTDEAGDSTHPIFQREAYGDLFKNWDVSDTQ